MLYARKSEGSAEVGTAEVAGNPITIDEACVSTSSTSKLSTKLIWPHFPPLFSLLQHLQPPQPSPDHQHLPLAAAEDGVLGRAEHRAAARVGEGRAGVPRGRAAAGLRAQRPEGRRQGLPPCDAGHQCDTVKASPENLLLKNTYFCL